MRASYNDINNWLVITFLGRELKMKKVIEILVAVVEVLVKGKQVVDQMNQLHEEELSHSAV